MRKQDWYVRLGETEWSRHTYARSQADPLRLLGSVRRGSLLGALAITSEGTYAQMVDDHTRPLNTGQISRAIQKARERQRNEPHLVQRTGSRSAPVPVLTVKRRRTFVPA